MSVLEISMIGIQIATVILFLYVLRFMLTEGKDERGIKIYSRSYCLSFSVQVLLLSLITISNTLMKYSASILVNLIILSVFISVLFSFTSIMYLKRSI